MHMKILYKNSPIPCKTIVWLRSFFWFYIILTFPTVSLHDFLWSCFSTPFPAYIHHVNYKWLLPLCLGYPLLSLFCGYFSNPCANSSFSKICLRSFQFVLTTQFSDIHCTDKWPLTISHTVSFADCFMRICVFSQWACTLEFRSYFICLVSPAALIRRLSTKKAWNTWLIKASFNLHNKSLLRLALGISIYPVYLEKERERKRGTESAWEKYSHC